MKITTDATQTCLSVLRGKLDLLVFSYLVTADLLLQNLEWESMSSCVFALGFTACVLHM